jgi:hypothetical protein
MAGLLDIFGTGGSDTMGLLGMSAADIQRNRDDAQAQALYALAGRLFQGGNTGQSIAEGLQLGQKAYRGGMSEAMQSQLQNFQLQEMLRKRKEDEVRREQEQRMRQLAPQIFSTTTTPEQVTFQGQPSQFPARDEEGNLMPDMAVRPAQTSRTIDTNKLQALAMMSPDPMAALASMAKLVPDLRKAGFIGGGGQEDNPFLQFTTDQTVPANLRNLATQYASSYQRGLIDPEKADQRVKEISDAIGRSQQFTQSQASLDAARAATEANQQQMRVLQAQGLDQSAEGKALANQIALGNQGLQKMMAEFKIEEKQEKKQEKVDTKNQAKQQLSNIVGQLKTSYDTLLEGGGITSTTTGGRENIGAKMGTSAVGQFMGSALGTKNQEQRQVIEQTRPLLLNLIKEATGMSASQMNSNAEMQMYLKAATDPKLSYEANVTALQNLDKTFGLGLLKDITPPKKKQQTTSSSWGSK